MITCKYYDECLFKINPYCVTPSYIVDCMIKKRKEEETMENKTLEKVLDMAGSATKLAANLSEAKKEPKPQPYNQTDDNSNKATTGSQTVVVSMEGKKKEPKPIEKHIHEFPESRALTEQECELALKRAQMEYELKKSEQAYFQQACDRDWRHQLEVEKKNERKGKIRGVIACLLAAIGVGGVGYSIYADYRDHKNNATVKTEGDAK